MNRALPSHRLLDERLRFPDPQSATDEGLVAVGGDFSPERLLLAYRSGIFELDQFHVPRSLQQALRKKPYRLSIDTAFRQVLEGCATPDARRGSTWITPQFIDAYTRLHEQGHAHSVECWRGDELVGGIYGVAVGGLFAGESMFHRADNASKIALHHLITHLQQHGFALFDIQMLTTITRQLGAIEISREEYLKRLRRAMDLKCGF